MITIEIHLPCSCCNKVFHVRLVYSNNNILKVPITSIREVNNAEQFSIFMDGQFRVLAICPDCIEQFRVPPEYKKANTHEQ